MFAADVFQRVAGLAVGEMRAAVGQNSRPQNVAANTLPLVRVEMLLREFRIGERLPAALLIQFGRDRRDHAVLAKQRPHRCDVDDGDKDDLKGGKGNDHLIGGAGDKLKQ